MNGVAGVILAAGGSSRLGAPKQLVQIDGSSLLARAARALTGSQCTDRAVVLGAHRAALSAEIAGTGLDVIANDDWSSGMASSVRAAVRWASALPCNGLLLMVCDQPHLTAAHLDALIARFNTERRTIGSAYAGTIGVPAIFERARFPELAALEGDRGARALLRDAASIDWPDGAIDVDTAADLARIRGLSS